MTYAPTAPSYVVDEIQTGKNSSDVVDEIQAEECLSDMVDETHAEEVPHPNELELKQQMKITGPCHQTLIFSNINNTNILPYGKKANSYFTQAIYAQTPTKQP
ncbi:hypothetical protein O181_085072 [Austropuccinia psidii MF-1]|uniref:Uncharacterized protein n=1 Tax=Austropuccinia psidii MF-1 TaxID=1389203 RepID=A0A9Q3FXE2_9BASI|nr:hypothetical protein [Austropuccinia psidii MF-1]